jgi:ATP-dependent DNA helicase RecQ
MSFYAQSALCRWRMMLEYFGESRGETPGETGIERCGACDNCLRAEPAEGRELRVDVQAPAWQRGDAVVVPRYGSGVVEAHGPDRVSVSFPNGVTKDFAPDFVSREL